MPFRILCTGDLHLGRRPSRVPEDEDATELTPRQAWEAFVAAAIERRVDAVALAGDLVDEANRFYEAFGALQSGTERLVQEGIAVLAVAGNHDWDVLPRLAGQIEAFHLLGAGGKWERIELPSADDGTKVRFAGWSFPANRVTESPLAGQHSAGDPGAPGPTIGLLHCECPATSGVYAPVALAELTGQPVDLWVLGHIHKGGLLAEGPPAVLYVGTPQGLDPTETGPHGAWLVTIEPGRPPQRELLPLGRLRWEQIAVALDGADSEPDFEQAVLGALRARHDAIRADAGGVQAVGCRLRMTGRTRLHRQVPVLAERLIADFRVPFDRLRYFIEGVEDDTRPDVPLEVLARSPDPAGLLAQRLTVLQRRAPTEAYEELIAAARESVSQQVPALLLAAGADPGAPGPLSDEQLREALLEAGLRGLTELLAQKEEAR